jgi:uncharacterized cupin superfamily protein
MRAVNHLRLEHVVQIGLGTESAIALNGSQRVQTASKAKKGSHMNDETTEMVVNVEDLKYTERRHGSDFDAMTASIGVQLGAVALGYNVTTIPTGKSPAPFHRHHANEEMCFVLSGHGSLRIGDDRLSIRKGDFICLKAGGAAHQLVNDSSEPMQILNVSTMQAPDVIEYPDSEKIGVFTGAAPGSPIPKQTMRRFARDADAVDYWDGES